ncbi:hypothetical protein HRbin33_02188 [bacterium HR33]|nr:hypothetical protein HRbin33_02188 [bacterium HR33]
MERSLKALTLVLALLGATACYHATIDTGRPPSPQTIERPWATSLIYGLVPPPVVETASRCPNGVSRVETQITFLNWLVGQLTLGIYTPMWIKVTCAAASSEDGAALNDKLVIDSKADLASKQLALTMAARRSAELGQPIWIAFR